MKPVAPHGNHRPRGFPFSRLREKGKRGESAGQFPPTAARGERARRGRALKPFAVAIITNMQ